MSTDQQYVGGRGGRQHEQMHERRIPVHDRFVPFLAPFLMTMIVIPLVEWLTYGVGHFRPEARDALVIGWLVTGPGLAMIAIVIGLAVTKRVKFVVACVAATVWLWGFASAVTTAYGWPLPWIIVHFFGSLVVATAWDLYRIDSLRTAANDGRAADVWGAAIGLARSRPRNVRTDDAHVIIEVEHGPGETMADVQSAAKRMESAAGAITGRTTVTAGDRADTSTITMTMADPFAQWRTWPGLSHPGGSFAHPMRTAYYATGADQWFAFVRSLPSPLTSFRSPNASFFGAAGMTGYGKSGFLANAAAEALSRRDCIVCWADAEKFMQNAGPFVDMLGMGAPNGPAGKQLVHALKALAAYRVQLFGQAQLDAILDPDAPQIGREWTPELYVETGEAAVLVVIDEADTLLGGSGWNWLATRGRSLGIFLLVATPRASAAEVPALFRGSIGAWKTFPIGDKYSDGFTMSQGTSDAGADPTAIREVGLHWLDMAPGVDPRMYPVLSREFKSDPGALRREVKAAREAFTPAAWTPAAIAAMGADYQALAPEVLMGLRGATPTPDVPTPGQPQSPVQAFVGAMARGALDGSPEQIEEARRIMRNNMTPSDVDPAAEDEEPLPEEDDMNVTQEGIDVAEDEVATLDLHQFYSGDDLRELANIDPHKPISQARSQGEPVRFDAPDPEGKPRWNDVDTSAELDRVIALFYREGRKEFGNADVMEAMRCEMIPSTCSRRLNGLAETQRIVPPGVRLERLSRGRFAPVAAPPRPHA